VLCVIRNVDHLTIKSEMPFWQRALLAVLGFIPWIAPYELIIKPDWSSYLNVFFAFAALVAVGAVVVSGLVFWAAIAGLNSQLVFDKHRGTLTYSAAAPVVRMQTVQCPIADIEDISLTTHDWTDGSPSYALSVSLADGRVFSSGSSWSKAEIEGMVAVVRSFLSQNDQCS
jgi:hypothetical protein